MSWPTNLTLRCVLCETVIAHGDDTYCHNCRRAFEAGRRCGMEIMETQVQGSVRGFARLRRVELTGESLDELLAGVEAAAAAFERERLAKELDAMRAQPADKRLERFARFLKLPVSPRP